MTDEELLDVKALYEKREKEILLELGKMKPEDANYQKLLNQAKTYAEIRNADETSELTRINNNAKNELEEARINIDVKKTKNETARIWVDLSRIAAAIYTSIKAPFVSYQMEEHYNSYKKMEQSMSRLSDNLLGRFK